MIWTPHCCCWTMHLATVQQRQCPPAAAMIRIILLMMAAPKTMAVDYVLNGICSSVEVLFKEDLLA